MADVDLSKYEMVSPTGSKVTNGLIKIWEKLGRPDDCSTTAGWIMVDQIVNCWTVFFKQEVADWQHDRKLDLDNEMILSAISKKGGGYNPITYPPTLFKLLKALLPGQKLTDKKFQRKLAQRHKLFLTTNLKI